MVIFLKRRKNLLIIIIAFFTLLIILTEYSQSREDDKVSTNSMEEPCLFPNLRTKLNVLDTVYTNKNNFIEVRLDLQKVFLHKKNSVTDTFLCSTGTDVVQDGIKTKPGIFTVKNKLQILISKQFNDTKCLSWIGFNYGIGFHALESHGYYWSLGKRSSSHGCIRLSKEDAKKLFDEVTIGTPVIVHSANNARVVSFLPEHYSYDTTYTKKELLYTLRNRLSLLYKDQYFSQKNIVVVLNDKFITHDGIDIGDKSKVPLEQHIPVQSDGFTIKTCIQDKSYVFDCYIPDSLNYIKYATKDSISINKTL